MKTKSGRQGSQRPDQRRRWDSGPPPAFLPLSGGGGGGPESGAHLFDGQDHSARINGARGNSGPPPAFLSLSGGGGPESKVHLSDGCSSSARINGAQAIWAPSVIRRLTNVGPPSCHVSLWTILPLAICSLPGRAMRLAPFYPFLIFRHLSLSPSLVHMVPFPFHHPSTACHVSRLIPRPPPTASAPIMSCIPLLPRIVSRHMSPPRHFSYTSSLLSFPAQFWPHHSVTVPHLPRWLPRLFFKPFSYSRWQRGRPSALQKCRVGRVILDPDEAVIEAVGGG
jgi:hypothetical protein